MSLDNEYWKRADKVAKQFGKKIERWILKCPMCQGTGYNRTPLVSLDCYICGVARRQLEKNYGIDCARLED